MSGSSTVTHVKSKSNQSKSTQAYSHQIVSKSANRCMYVLLLRGCVPAESETLTFPIEHSRQRPIDDQQRRNTSDLSSNGGRTMLTSPKLARLFARLLADGGARRSVRGRDAACRVQHAHPPGMDRGYIRERNRVVSFCSRDLLATIPHAYTDLRVWNCGGTFLSIQYSSPHQYWVHSCTSPCPPWWSWPSQIPPLPTSPYGLPACAGGARGAVEPSCPAIDKSQSFSAGRPPGRPAPCPAAGYPPEPPATPNVVLG